MEIKSKTVNPSGIKFFIKVNDLEIARAYLYILYNDSHEKPLGYLEDVFVHEDYRGQGLGKKIVSAAIDEAKRKGCYKLICTSRYENTAAQKLYEKLGFMDHGKEYRIDF